MSNKSSFRERLERPEKAKVVPHDPSAFPIEIQIEAGKAFRSPVSLAMLLRDHGLGLAGGHAAVTEMATSGHVEVVVHVADPDDLIRQLVEMGLTARVTQDVTSR